MGALLYLSLAITHGMKIALLGVADVGVLAV